MSESNSMAEPRFELWGPARLETLVRCEGRVRLLEALVHPKDGTPCCLWVEREYSGRYPRSSQEVEWSLSKERMEYRSFVLETADGFIRIDMDSLHGATLNICDLDLVATVRGEVEKIPSEYRDHFNDVPRRFQTGVLRENDVVFAYRLGTTPSSTDHVELFQPVDSGAYRGRATQQRCVADLTRPHAEAPSGLFKGTCADYMTACKEEYGWQILYGLVSLAIGGGCVHLFS
jgi:hypothetical protein